MGAYDVPRRLPHHVASIYLSTKDKPTYWFPTNPIDGCSMLLAPTKIGDGLMADLTDSRKQPYLPTWACHQIS